MEMKKLLSLFIENQRWVQQFYCITDQRNECSDNLHSLLLEVFYDLKDFKTNKTVVIGRGPASVFQWIYGKLTSISCLI